MPLLDDDNFMVGRGDDTYKCSALQIADYVADGHTGDVVVDGVTLTFTNGLLTNVT